MNLELPSKHCSGLQEFTVLLLLSLTDFKTLKRDLEGFEGYLHSMIS